MFLQFKNIKKSVCLMLIFVCNSRQRPQLEVEISNTTTESIDTTTEQTKNSENISQVTQATAVSVQTTVNVSSFSPSQVFEDFEPSKYYRPDGNPIFEKPSLPVDQEVFYNPHYFKRPNNLVYQPSPKPSDKNIIFPPQVFRDNYSQSFQSKNNSNGPESRSPQRFTEVLPQYKPIKHDSGEITPYYSSQGNNYDRYFGKYQGNEMLHYPDVIHEPQQFHPGITTHKKKDPWKSIFSVLATVLPVGLLLASFPPTVIKVDSTQYPYQFQKNTTMYNPNTSIIIGRNKVSKKKNSRRKIDIKDESPDYLDDCLKNKICKNLKTNCSPSELNFLLQNNKINLMQSNQIVEIAKVAISAAPESCQVFVCSN